MNFTLSSLGAAYMFQQNNQKPFPAPEHCRKKKTAELTSQVMLALISPFISWRLLRNVFPLSSTLPEEFSPHMTRAHRYGEQKTCQMLNFVFLSRIEFKQQEFNHKFVIHFHTVNDAIKQSKSLKNNDFTLNVKWSIGFGKCMYAG